MTYAGHYEDQAREREKMNALHEQVIADAEIIKKLEAHLTAAREAMQDALDDYKNLAEYWNRDRNDGAMHDSCWHTIEIAEAQIKAITAALASSAASGDSGDNQRSGVQLIAAERQRQMSVEGWTPEHDAQHSNGELAVAAACYALPYTAVNHTGLPILWPWAREWWKPKDRIRNLERAGALIAAEIDRLMRVDAPSEASGDSAPEGAGSMNLHEIKVRLCLPTATEPFAMEDCEIEDIGHSDKILIVSCPQATALTARLADLVAAAEPFLLLVYYPSMIDNPEPLKTLAAAIAAAKEALK